MVALLASAALSATAPARAADSSRFELRVPVLYYHHVLCPPSDATIPDLYICPDEFSAQMSYLRDKGWQTITVDQLADLMANRQCPAPQRFVVSFDDGPVDQYDNAAPILESLGYRGSFFVTTGVEGGLRLGKISWDQLRDLIARGHAIGDHSQTHLNLKVQPPDVLHEQIEVAQQIFAEQLGYRPRTFAYPYGRYNDSVIAQVATSGFELGFTVHAGAKEDSADPYEAKRIEILAGQTGADVMAKMEPFADGCRNATPDLTLGLSSTGPFKGDDVYYSGPSRTQTLTRRGVQMGHLYRYWMQLQNDAQLPGQFELSASVSGTATMDVRYRVAGKNVTARVNAGTFITPPLAPWTATTIVVEITPRAGSPGQSTVVQLQASSVSDPIRIDVGRAIASY